MQRGFSLVELSIVLVILGLLTGGILAGQSLIRASELRSITIQKNVYFTAIASFRDKYFALPGDMGNATSFWGKDNTNCSGHSGAAATPGTCNGDADGFIENATGAGATGETFQAWKQMALAGLIEGSYSGLSGAGGAVEYLAGVNAPATKISGGAWQLLHFTTVTGNSSSTLFDGVYGLVLRTGKPVAAQQPIDPLFRPEEAWNMDTKTDDGMPGSGSFMAPKSTATYSGGCTSSDAPTTATYSLSSSNVLCFVVFKTGL